MQKSGKSSFLLAREMAEAVFGLGGMFGLSWWLPVSWRPSHLIFCALFLVVFAIAVRYQTLVAYSASSLAAISYGLLLWLHPAARAQPDFLYLALEPFLLLMSGIGVSDILRWQRQRLAALERKYAHTQETLQRTQTHCQQLSIAREALERQVVGLPTSIALVSDKLAQLWTLEGDKRSSAMVDLLVSVIEAHSCALYLKQNDQLCLCAERIIEGSAHAPVLNTVNPLVKRAIEQRRVSTIYDFLAEGEGVPPAGAVMAGPLLDPTDELAGVVIIESMPLLKLTPGTARLFGSLLQILSLSSRTGVAGLPGENQASIDPDLTEPVLPAQTNSRIVLSQ